MHSFETVRMILAETLSLGDRAATMTADTALLDSLPELDSMAVIQVITAIEDQFGIVFDDDDMNAATFESVRSLCALVDCKRMA